MTQTAPAESPYAAQLDDRFRTLRFEPALEREYRRHHIKVSRTRIVACLFTAVVISVTLMLLNRPHTSAFAGDALLNQLDAWLMRPLTLGLIVLAAMPRQFQRFWLGVAPPVVAIVGTIGAFGVAALVSRGDANAFISLLAGLMTIYLLMGLLFWQMFVVGLVIAATYAVSLVHHGAATDLLQFHAAVIFAMTALALVFNYGFEHNQRVGFLQKRILEQIGNHDSLTQLKNRRAFDDRLARLWRQGMRDDKPIGLLLLDVDHFKAYNDEYGHQAGDLVLKRVASVLSRIGERPFDVAARIGGEEFALLLYGCTREHLTMTAERIVMGVQGLNIPHSGTEAIDSMLTASVGGVLVLPQSGRTPEGLMQFADESLYHAKRNGRNQAIVRREGYDDVITGSFQVRGRAGGDPEPAKFQAVG